MTAALQPNLRWTMVLSGSVHLGLIAILAWPTGPVVRSLSQIEVSFLEPRQEIVAAVPRVALPVPAVAAVKPKADTAPAEQSATVSEIVAPQAAVSEAVASGPVNPALHDAYASQVAREINRRKVYPPVALKLRQQGRVKVQFRVARSGAVVQAEVLEESAHEQLNRAAKRLIEEIRQFQPFPDDVKETSWLFTVPIEYTM